MIVLLLCIMAYLLEGLLTTFNELLFVVEPFLQKP